MRLKKGLLKDLSEASGLNVRYLSDLAATRSRPGRNRAIELEEAAKSIGLNIPAEIWIFGSKEEIKGMLADEYSKSASRGYCHSQAD